MVEDTKLPQPKAKLDDQKYSAFADFQQCNSIEYIQQIFQKD